MLIIALAKPNTWKTPRILMAFFNRLAHEKNFHPAYEFERWYDVKQGDLLFYKVCLQ